MGVGRKECMVSTGIYKVNKFGGQLNVGGKGEFTVKFRFLVCATELITVLVSEKKG